MHTILHPTDFSATSRYAFETACSLARANDATLLVLHVMMPSVSPVQEAPPLDPLRPVDSQEAWAQLRWPQSSDTHVRVEHRLAEGDAGAEILRLADAARCGLIVMGTHSRTGLRRLWAGSVVEAVLREATCPVLVVKVPLGVTPAVEPQATSDAGEPVDVRPLGPLLAVSRTRKLVHTTALQVLRLVVLAGRVTPERRTEGETLVHCLEGRVALAALGKVQAIDAGQFLLLPVDEPYAVHGIDDASLLLTIVGRRS